MTRLDMLIMQETDAHRAFDRKLATLAQLVADAQDSTLTDAPAPVRSLHVKALAVQEASDIWEATKHAVSRERHARRQVYPHRDLPAARIRGKAG